MKSLGLKYFTDIDLTNLGLLVFLFVFVSVVCWVYRRGSEKIYQHVSTIPLKDEESHG